MSKIRSIGSEQAALPKIRRRRTAENKGSGESSSGTKSMSTAEESPRERIMKVAAHLFSLRGFAGTTMADIADSVGIRSPSLYYHFKDKSDILEAIANLAMDLALSDSRRMVEDETLTISQRFYFLVHDLVFHLCESAYDLDCMFDAAFHQEEFRTVNGKLKDWLKDMEYLIKAGTATGVFAPQNPKVAAYTVRGLIIAAIRRLGGYSVINSEDRADYVAQFAVKGLMPSDPMIGKVER